MVQFSRPYDSVVAKRVHPNGTGYVNRLYELRGFPERTAQVVEERFLKPADSLAADALSILETENWQSVLSDRRRSAWSRFIISLLMRCPEDIAVMREYWNLVFEEADPEAAAHYLTIRAESDPATLSEYISQAPLAERERGFLRAFLELVDNANVGHFLNGMPAVVIDTSSCGIELLTSDRPVIMTNGLNNDEGHLALPIGPKRLFLSAHREALITSLLNDGIEHLVRAANRVVVRGAKKYVYARNEDDASFVQKNMSADVQPRLIENMLRDYRAGRETKS